MCVFFSRTTTPERQLFIPISCIFSKNSELLKSWPPDQYWVLMKGLKFNRKILKNNFQNYNATICETPMQASSDSVDINLLNHDSWTRCNTGSSKSYFPKLKCYNLGDKHANIPIILNYLHIKVIHVGTFAHFINIFVHCTFF